MKTIKILLSFALATTLFTSCYVESNIVEETPRISINQLLGSYDLWYVDINSTKGYGTTPFLQKAFTLSFKNGIMFANNNLVGIGSTGNGYGIAVADYDAYDMILDVVHDVDGFETFDVFQIDYNTIELYNPNNDTSYFLDGYQRSNFDYDFVFYDNIHYFLQEYVAWEKTFTSNFGAINDFDNENFLQFVAGGTDDTFRSSQDLNGTPINGLLWDYTGIYGVGDIVGNPNLKTLSLDYDYFNNEYFELSVIDDGTIELFHPASETVYEFQGRGYIQFMKNDGVKTKSAVKRNDLRKAPKNKVNNPRENTRTI